MSHIPVLLKESLDILNIKNSDRVLDATFGGGGHTKAILNSCSCFVTGIDRDPEALNRAEIIKENFAKRFEFILGNFSNIQNIVTGKYDAVLFDFGVSSFQLDNAERGFSFLRDGKLDMRMSKEGISAFDVVNDFNEEELSEIIWTYGDEKDSRKIAKEIVKNRQLKKIETTKQLQNIINDAIINKRNSKIDKATKTFQAIRIYVNDELKEIYLALFSIKKVLNNGARVAAISFHSLEDRIVKNWGKSDKSIFPINRSPIKPSNEEVKNNPRSRSAILRGFTYNMGIGDRDE